MDAQRKSTARNDEEQRVAIHAEDLRRYLEESTGRPVVLRMNNNSHSLINARPDRPGRGIRVSIHRLFLTADDDVLEALARFIVSPTPSVRQTIREYINRNHHRIAQGNSAAAPPRKITGTARGRAHHLDQRARRLNEKYFRGQLEFRIIWGRATRGGRRQRHVTLGTWNDRQKLIRIHPMLDNERVPTYFLDYIIYHEMVHIAVPASVSESGRRHIHTEEFYRLERAFAHYTLAAAWEKKWFPRLLRAWNGGSELPPQASDFFPV